MKNHELRDSAKEVARWLRYILDHNPQVGRMCRAEIYNEDGRVTATQPVSMLADLERLEAELGKK